MKILQINFYDMFSTGNIMLNIARVARERGYEAYTASKRTGMSLARHRVDPWHFYIGTRTEHTIHRHFSWMTDLQDCGSVFATFGLIRKIKKLKPDIIHLHDIVGWYVNIGMLFSYLKKCKIPVIWTFHDCWAFTGRCIYFDAVGCERWKTGCGNCPQIHYMPRSNYFDLSAWNFRRKKRLFTGLERLTIVTPSDWLRRLTAESFFKGTEARVINNGIDLNVFRPTEGKLYHQLQGEGKIIILGVAATWSPRKGMEDFKRLANDLPDTYQVVLVGATPEECGNHPRIKCIQRTHHQEELAQVYSAASVFVNPTIEDNFPTVNLESLACGTPVVTYRTGGSAECIDELTGIAIKKGHYDELLRAVKKLVEDGKEKYAQACINKAKCYDMHARFNDYVDLYEEVLRK